MLQFTDGNSKKGKSEVVAGNGSAVPSGTEAMEEVPTSTGSTGPEAVCTPPISHGTSICCPLWTPNR